MESASAVVFFVVFNIIFTILATIFFSILQGNKTHFKGPFPIPLLGNVVTLKRLRSNPDEELLHLKERWGDICMLWFVRRPMVIINSPRIAKELLNDRGFIYSSRPEQDNFRRNLWPWRLISIPAGDDFRFLRRLYNTYLSPQHCVLFRKYQEYESRQLVKELSESPQTFLRSIERYTMSVIFSAVYGIRVADLNNPTLVEFNDIWNIEMKYFTPGTLPIDFIPALQLLPEILQPWRRRLVPLVQRETDLHMALLETLRKAVKAGQAPDCFAKLLLEIQEKDHISDIKSIHILAMLIGAGADTTASVLQSFFKIIALHPQAMQKAQTELDSVVGPDRMPTWEDEESLPYIRSLIKEVHRFNPIGSLGVPHTATKDDIYEGKKIPKGSLVVPNGTALSKDPERYPNPEAFDPDRFRGDNLSAAASALHKNHLRRDHFHYGFGRRMCPGIHVAEASLFIVITRLLWGFNINAKPGQHLDMKDKRMILVWKPKPYEVDIVSRGLGYTQLMRDTSEKVNTGVLAFEDVTNIISKKLY